MRQFTLLEVLHPNRYPLGAEEPCLEVWDLFCGAGGFTTGAKAAGHAVAYACDACGQTLAVYHANHPEVPVHHLRLPEVVAFPTDGRRFHVHGSPPCQRFSNPGRRYNTHDTERTAEDLVSWYVQTAVTSGASSWSMEQVASRETLALMDALRRKYPSKVAYASVNMHDLGVPQKRTRLIAGSPHLIARLLGRCSHARRRSVRDALPYARGTHLRTASNWTKRRLRRKDEPGTQKYVYVKAALDELCHPIDGPAPTVVCNGDLRWTIVRPGYEATRAHVHYRERAVLQTFPATYVWAKNVRLTDRCVGNAMPPLVAQLLLTGDTGASLATLAPDTPSRLWVTRCW